MLAKSHPREPERLAALRRFGILDTPREAAYDDIVDLVADVCDVPIAVINLIDEHRQWFKAEVGLGVRETPLETSICSHVILSPGLTIIPDTLEDDRTRDNALCTAKPNLRFYAGMCLETDDGLPIGTLCALDSRPRELTPQQVKFLTVLGRQVMSQISLGKQLKHAELLRQEVDHRVKNSLSVVQSVLRLHGQQSKDGEIEAALNMARKRVNAISLVHDLLHESVDAYAVNLEEFLARLANSLAAQTNDNVTISVESPSVNIAAGDAANLGLIVNEIATNAFRHAFQNDGTGRLSITATPHENRARLEIVDDGKGLPPGFDPRRSSGLGMKLSLALARGFGSELSYGNTHCGARFSFDFPLPRNATVSPPST